jgi:hypothetical protein
MDWEETSKVLFRYLQSQFVENRDKELLEVCVELVKYEHFDMNELCGDLHEAVDYKLIEEAREAYV